MTERTIHNFNFSLENEKGQIVVKGEISGNSEVPSLDDLKFNAVIALLNSIDKKNFGEVEKAHLFEEYIKEIEETMKEITIHDEFQGEIR
ncbi:hypothetical protein [Mesobacillus maritimus]|uniref:hypothetical protein n=1 Tax=Mesobacillus maritimus TaxID=1643336 RepID=UPI00384CA039